MTPSLSPVLPPSTQEPGDTVSLADPFRYHAPDPYAEPQIEETLVVDARGSLRPSQMVEQKLMRLLKGKAVRISQLQMSQSIRSRS